MWIILCLLWLSVEDVLDGQISMAIIFILGITGAGYSLYTGRGVSLFPGIMLLLFSYFTKEQIGYGDGWLFLALGMWISSIKLAELLLRGLLLSIVWAVCQHRKVVPLVPFLTISYVIGELC
ncbi:MAG: hypothetical protein IKV59_06930 [Lachnospiraceae bacterium]|nr:hypothetical protein [Lachnospiraceae bacterium]